VELKRERSRKERKGLMTNEEVLEEIKVVRREMENGDGVKAFVDN
jgi:hypothetical protein